ncbi:unnamed protein product, partial [Discosporangium mesarthrocarpum]
MCIGTAPPSPLSAIRPAPYPWRTILGWHSLLTPPSSQSPATPAARERENCSTCEIQTGSASHPLWSDANASTKGLKFQVQSSRPWRLHRQMMLDGMGKGRTQRRIAPTVTAATVLSPVSLGMR